MAIVGYKLKVNGGAYVDRIIDVGNVLTYEVDALTHGVEYGFQVASYNEEGVDSLYSSVVYGTPLAPTIVLDEDGNALLDEDGNVIIIWS